VYVINFVGEKAEAARTIYRIRVRQAITDHEKPTTLTNFPPAAGPAESIFKRQFITNRPLNFIF